MIEASAAASRLDAAIEQARERLARPLLVALDGRSGAGKSTLAAGIAERHDAVVIAADDFWTGGDEERWTALSPPERARRAIDWRRLRREVLEPLLAGRGAAWRTLDSESGAGLAPYDRHAAPASVVVLDGAYSARPEMADLIDVAVLVTLDDAVRRDRLLARGGEDFMRRWHAIWDDAEEDYFTHVRPPGSFDLVVSGAPRD